MISWTYCDCCITCTNVDLCGLIVGILTYITHSQFTSFSTEEGLDVLEIWDGGPTLLESTLVGRISGRDPAKFAKYTSSVNHVILRYITDDTVEKAGFSLTWTTGFFLSFFLVLICFLWIC